MIARAAHCGIEKMSSPPLLSRSLWSRVQAACVRKQQTTVANRLVTTRIPCLDRSEMNFVSPDQADTKGIAEKNLDEGEHHHHTKKYDDQPSLDARESTTEKPECRHFFPPFFALNSDSDFSTLSRKSLSYNLPTSDRRAALPVSVYSFKVVAEFTSIT
jgi:hypothetical protein